MYNFSQLSYMFENIEELVAEAKPSDKILLLRVYLG